MSSSTSECDKGVGKGLQVGTSGSLDFDAVPVVTAIRHHIGYRLGTWVESMLYHSNNATSVLKLLENVPMPWAQVKKEKHQSDT